MLEFIALLEQWLGCEAIKQLEPMQPGDVEAIAADTAALEVWVGFRPATPLAEGGGLRWLVWRFRRHNRFDLAL